MIGLPIIIPLSKRRRMNVDNFDFKNKDFEEYKTLVFDILSYPKPPEADIFKSILKETLTVYNSENEDIRPKDKNGFGGGLIDLRGAERAVIIPDLHARRTFLKETLLFSIDKDGVSIFERLEDKSLTVLCLGDGVHSEGAYLNRWLRAYDEYKKGFDKSTNMDMEIADSFNLMLAVMLLKIRYTDNFHFLKGNHENILNETANGNFAFAKFANEGAMTLSYFQKKYDEEILANYSKFEKELPLFVVGKNFLASHSEPGYFFTRDEIINHRDNSDLITALTWTDNYSAEEGSVDKIISYFIPENDEHTYYFGGHRPIKDLYNKINNDRYVQIHNPRRKIICLADRDKQIDLDRDIIEIVKDEKKSIFKKEKPI